MTPVDRHPEAKTFIGVRKLGPGLSTIAYIDKRPPGSFVLAEEKSERAEDEFGFSPSKPVSPPPKLGST